ncbi:amino acid ABC transporter substrate-binding protein [Mesorhizobium sp. ES1-4]|uniref:amino acid ABC transporter substrate-binding protein n=1 Tax=Mesorhizobium sp. ES1-4 TaxID=2876627 RepID=UPI001CCCC88F|nr:amino acid ABC transporter substrate-binding protein [Mesorhizobium sp. ES1-4]MBZ9798442.1 amino acid ABC transporter substrate-binding protein [Mesorhizobium sp. ES1-4]
MKTILTIAGTVIGMSLMASAAHAGPTLDTIKKNDYVRCGVNTGLGGFSIPNSGGQWVGLDVDMCRAFAAAALGDANKVKFVPLSSEQRFTALQSGEIDVLSRNTTWTITREGELGALFGPVTYYDGQGFMVNKKLGVKSAKELNGATICVQPGTTTELNLSDYFHGNNMQFTPVVIDSLAQVNAAFFSGRCDVYTDDASALTAVRAAAPNSADYEILPERISKEPLAPAVRQGDDEWFDIVRWSIFATLQAEEWGITSQNVDTFKDTKNPDIQRFLGVTAGIGKPLHLDDKWAVNIVKQVGNYSEIYERNLGAKTPLKLDRGLNALWNKGGLMYAPPAR